LYTPTRLDIPLINEIQAANIKRLLASYPNQCFVNNLVRIAHHSAQVGFTGTTGKTFRPNHSSIKNHIEVIDKYIAKEVTVGRIKEVSLPQSYFCSPLGLIPKK
jgi:hypothetical protein